MWGTGPADVWAVGTEGTLAHFDGVGWSAVPSGTTSDLYGLGSGPSDVWAVGGRDVLHWVGTGWTKKENGANDGLSSVWGFGPTDVCVAGGDQGPTLLTLSNRTSVLGLCVQPGP